ncbi:flavodoxin family protein [Helicobacter muridarum]|uniref:Flavodoxin family protein n=1 Tax=Helicobacter muridarum TaxID=216 RepID=A0A099U0P3_9HELI|nr:NAD(P)H-dependent oxidoreductase [Helicobacter muridarum]TLD99285.1 flavodoxin family protein [Helicobacter muridarum]STQ86125.1 NAD(P)H dehydrogenase [Helicobacter muridarum]
MQTLIIFAHTFWDESKVNRALLKEVERIETIKIHNLTTTYPDNKIDINKEIALLSKADKIIFQFPMFWYSTPSIMKEWQDRVLTTISDGKNPELLKGKQFQIITTAGSKESSFDGHHGYTIDTLLSPLYNSFGYMGCEILIPCCMYEANENKLELEHYLSCIQRGKTI